MASVFLWKPQGCPWTPLSCPPQGPSNLGCCPQAKRLALPASLPDAPLSLGSVDTGQVKQTPCIAYPFHQKKLAWWVRICLRSAIMDEESVSVFLAMVCLVSVSPLPLYPQPRSVLCSLPPGTPTPPLTSALPFFSSSAQLSPPRCKSLAGPPLAPTWRCVPSSRPRPLTARPAPHSSLLEAGVLTPEWWPLCSSGRGAPEPLAALSFCGLCHLFLPSRCSACHSASKWPGLVLPWWSGGSTGNGVGPEWQEATQPALPPTPRMSSVSTVGSQAASLWDRLLLAGFQLCAVCSSSTVSCIPLKSPPLHLPRTCSQCRGPLRCLTLASHR